MLMFTVIFFNHTSVIFDRNKMDDSILNVFNKNLPTRLGIHLK